MNVGALRHSVSLANPTTAPDSDGGYTPTYAALSPATVPAEIAPATARDLERAMAGTVIAQATHLVRMRYHSGVTTKTRITFGSRVFQVNGVVNPDERNIETVCAVVEVVA